MPKLDETLEALAKVLKREGKLERDRRELLSDATLPKAFRDEQDAALQQQIESVRKQKLRTLDELVRYPPFHDRHFSKLDQFHANAGAVAGKPFEKSVFIMTKFPDGNNPLDGKLQAVIDATRTAVSAAGHVPRVASDAVFHPLLWDNVELYLLGSCRGIAILESRYRPELNPNVAMEWGWMRGMGRRILPLVEKDFAYIRADWGGLIESRFSWDDPVPGITAAVQAFLADNGA